MNGVMIEIDREQIQRDYGLLEESFYQKLRKGIKDYPSQFTKVKRGKYFIDHSIMDEVFKRRRRSKIGDNIGLRRETLGTKWDYVGGIRPSYSNGEENVEIMNLFFEQFKTDLGPQYIDLHYFVEVNPKQKRKSEDPQCHTHFLIRTDQTHNVIRRIQNLLKTYTNEDYTSTFFEVYKPHWEWEGKSYCVKDVSKSSLCGRLNYVRRST